MSLTYAGRAVHLDDALVVADLHLGRETAANVQLPLGANADVVERIESLLERFGPEEVVLAGDVVHSFESVPEGVAATLSDLRTAIREAGARAVVTPGNHDVMLDRLWDGPTADAYRVGDAVVCHGHERPDAEADRYVVGHDHPVIVVEGQRRPCYLRGETGSTEVVMLPAFDRLARGRPINDMDPADFQSPLMADAETLWPVVRDRDAEETLSFPPLSQFRKML